MEVDSLVTMNNYSAGTAYTKSAETAVAEQPRTTDTGSSVNINKSTKQNKTSNSQTTRVEVANDPDADISAIDKAIEKANKQLQSVGREFNYSVHEKTRQIMIKVLDRESKEIIREIPPEKALDAIARMWELAGILIDEKR